MMEEEEISLDCKMNIKRKRYRHVITDIQKLVQKHAILSVSWLVPMLIQQLTMLAKLLLKNVFKKQPYGFEFVRLLIRKVNRNVRVLERLLIESIKHHLNLQNILYEQGNGMSVMAQAAEILNKVTFDVQIDQNRYIRKFLQALLHTSLAVSHSLKQYGYWSCAFTITRTAYNLAVKYKDSHDYRILEKIIESMLCYASFLNELGRQNASEKVIDQILLVIANLFYRRFSTKSISCRKQTYKFQKLWKYITVSLCLNLNNLTSMQQYDRIYETCGFIEWTSKQTAIQSYAFKKCLSILVDQPSKLIERHVEVNDQLKKFVKHFFQDDGLEENQGLFNTSNTPSQFYDDMMFQNYQSQGLDRKVIVTWKNDVKCQVQQKEIKGKKHKISQKVTMNRLLDDKVINSILHENLFDKENAATLNRTVRTSAKNRTQSARRNKEQRPVSKLGEQFFRQFMSPRMSLCPRMSVQSQPSQTTSNQTQALAQADLRYFRNQIEKTTNIDMNPLCQTTVFDQRQRKQYKFIERQFKFRNTENLVQRENSFINITQQKLKIKQQSEFILNIKPKPNTKCDPFIKKNEHGVEVSLTGVKLFVEIILENKQILGLTKLYDKHEQVKKKRETESRMKRKNQEKQKLKLLYKLQENKRCPYDQELYCRLAELRQKRRAKVYKQSPISEKLRLQNDPNSRTQQIISFKKQISHNNEKSQLIIKKFSQKIQENLRSDSLKMDKTLKKSSILDEKFNSLRQTIISKKFTIDLP